MKGLEPGNFLGKDILFRVHARCTNQGVIVHNDDACC